VIGGARRSLVGGPFRFRGEPHQADRDFVQSKISHKQFAIQDIVDFEHHRRLNEGRILDLEDQAYAPFCKAGVH
jgi:hypothetical protein